MKRAIVLAAVITSGCQAREATMHETAATPTSSVLTPREDHVVTARADGLGREFRLDAATARDRYAGRLVSVTGDVQKVWRGDGFTDATLRWRGSRDGVEASLVDGADPATASLRSGQTITVACSDLDSASKPVMLRHCDFVGTLDRD